MLDNTLELGIVIDNSHFALRENFLINFITFNMARLDQYYILVYDADAVTTVGTVLSAYKLNPEFVKLYEQMQAGGEALKLDDLKDTDI